MAISAASRTPRAASPGSGPISSTSCAAPSTDPPGPARRQIWGRRSGPTLRRGRREALATLLPRLGFTLPETGPLEPRGLFEGPVREVWVEIGFGGGEHLLAQATTHPEVGLIGVEPFLGGVARVLAEAGAHGLRNVRVLVDDARLLLAALPEASIGRLFVLFPDPWPKLRHHKRRIVSPATVAAMARVLAPCGELRLATDDPDYALAMEHALAGETRLTFARLAERPADWPGTRYEAKAQAAGRAPIWLRAERRP